MYDHYFVLPLAILLLLSSSLLSLRVRSVVAGTVKLDAEIRAVAVFVGTEIELDATIRAVAVFVDTGIESDAGYGRAQLLLWSLSVRGLVRTGIDACAGSGKICAAGFVCGDC